MTINRRTFITTSTAAPVGLPSNPISAAGAQRKQPPPTATGGFWPNNARLLISFYAIRSRVVRYSFRGHFTARFKDLEDDGREIRFRAVDIYCVQGRQISDNWHLEDNLSLMQQLGVVTP